MDNHLTARRIALELDHMPGGQAWYLIATSRPQEVVAELARTFGVQGVAYAQRSPAHPDDLLAPGSTVALITGAEAWDAAAWEHLDRLRTLVLAAWPRLIWIIEPAAAGRLIHHAPHVAAFFAPDAGGWSAEPVAEEVPRSAAPPTFDGGFAAPPPPPPGSYAAQAAERPGGRWLLFEDDQLVDAADRLADLRRWPRADGRAYFVISRSALP